MKRFIVYYRSCFNLDGGHLFEADSFEDARAVFNNTYPSPFYRITHIEEMSDDYKVTTDYLLGRETD